MQLIFLLFMPWGLTSGFLAVNALLTLIMVPYASDLLLWGVLYRGMGDACFIKALFSPGIVLYQMYNMREKKKKVTSRVLLHKDKYREKSFMSVQYLFNLDNLTVLQYNAYANWMPDQFCHLETFILTLHNCVYTHPNCT